MQTLYVAGAYRAPSEWQVLENIRAAETVALALWRMGYAALCPHKNTAHFGGAVPDERLLAGDLALLARCDGAVFLPGWQVSAGAKSERRFAYDRDIPCYDWPKDQGLLRRLAGQRKESSDGDL